tara:strand:+ start:1742 stop:2107 length:366 start_codon:yes stop_codon:yes gene_type:complete
MEIIEEEDFDKTLLWAVEEEKLRTTRGQGIGTFYLVIASLFIVATCFLFLYFSNRGTKKTKNAIDLMRDPDNMFDNFSETYEDDVEGDEEEEEVPLIELSEEEVFPEEPEIENLPKLKKSE